MPVDKIRRLEVNELVGRNYVTNAFIKNDKKGNSLQITKGDEYAEVAYYDEEKQCVCYKMQKIEELI